ncbi:mitochondrial amidoxime-reducing component 1 isoform X2 [Gouania willdenowi]|uniref:mitochondrial amidoxime-reducing component 1 isoform X2 n=1 Tax=Gouania willdenowi TaxID=441366 RepID=UPI00105639C4|nr:mitochondrial amidoxime-reducing component 1-like isoform X2 [Gouania willdenowi]
MDVKELLHNRKAVLLAGGAGVVVVLGLGLGYKYLWRSEKAVRVGKVSQLLIHPLKSGKGASVSRAECVRFGLKAARLQDRHWMVVTEDGHMVTARQEPRLVMVSLTCEGGLLCLSGPNMEELCFPIDQRGNAVINCRVFGADIQGRDCGDKTSEWLTSYLDAGKTFRLVHFEREMTGRMSVKIEPLFPQNEVAYSDVGPVMLLSEASVKDLSSRLEKDVTVERFRPNIVISDCEAYDEDSWEEIQIGSVRLQRVMSCGRCVLTTVDPETGIITRKEPLDTLKSYRMCKPSEKHIYKTSPLFGQLHVVKKTGTIQVGDVVYNITH